uniref:J domain-containing protein n=1 Tax=Prymnesium polylepis TaxID=72548 RepID=A0A7S4M6S4_9EUKA
MRWHPDRPGGCETRFRDICLAAQELQSTANFRRHHHAHAEAEPSGAERASSSEAWERDPGDRWEQRPFWEDSPFWEEGQAERAREEERRWQQREQFDQDEAQDRKDGRTVRIGVKILMAYLMFRATVFWGFVNSIEPDLSPELKRHLELQRAQMHRESMAARGQSEFVEEPGEERESASKH